MDDSAQQVEDPKRQKVELKGPRVKHVCRSASIVLGQPIATFPTQDAKERLDKDEDEASLLCEKEETASSLAATCDPEPDSENKPPQVVPDVPVLATDTTEVAEAKKKKMEPIVALKTLTKGETSEDETVTELVPRKTVMKPLSNITNVSIVGVLSKLHHKCNNSSPKSIIYMFFSFSCLNDELDSTLQFIRHLRKGPA